MIINDLTLKWRELEGDRILPFQDWLQRIQNRYGRTVDGEIPGRIVFVGELGKFAEAVTQFKRAMELPITTQERTIHAPDIAWLAWNRLNRGESDDVHSLQPNYTQLAEAEQKLLSRQK